MNLRWLDSICPLINVWICLTASGKKPSSCRAVLWPARAWRSRRPADSSTTDVAATLALYLVISAHVNNQQINTWPATYYSNVKCVFPVLVSETWLFSIGWRNVLILITTWGIASFNISEGLKSEGCSPTVDLAAQVMMQVALRACSGFSREFQTGQWTILDMNEFPFCWWPAHGEQIKRHAKLYTGVWNSLLTTGPLGGRWRRDTSEP